MFTQACVGYKIFYPRSSVSTCRVQILVLFILPCWQTQFINNIIICYSNLYRYSYFTHTIEATGVGSHGKHMHGFSTIYIDSQFLIHMYLCSRSS